MIGEKELLEALEQAEDSGSSSIDNDMISFLISYKIETGKHRVTTKLLYALYSFWSEAPMTKTNFYKALELVFPTTKTNPVWKFVNKDVHTLLAELFKLKVKKNKKLNHGLYQNKKLVDEFFVAFKVGRGKNWVPSMLLYEKLLEWLKTTNKASKGMGHKRFTRLCKLLFRHKTNNKITTSWFAISNCSNMDINKDVINKYLKDLSEKNKQKK